MSTITIASITPTSGAAEVAAVCWEPCRAFLAHDTDDGTCEACGWSSDDHELATAA